jgi:hypothetical protein
MHPTVPVGTTLQVVGAFAASSVLVLAAYWVVFVTRIGPVALTIDRRAGHGVHTGDVLALPLVLLAAIAFFGGVVALERAMNRRAAPAVVA